MSRPTIDARSPGIYVLRWSDYHILMRLDRLKERSESVSAEILIKSSLPDLPSHLHFARLNLTSTAAQRGLSKALIERFGEDTPWGEMVEQARVMVLEHYRAGDPAIPLGSVPLRESLRWRVHPLLVEKQVNVFYGNGQTGKSLLAAFLAVLVESPLNVCGLTVEPGMVLYLDYEADVDELAERVRAFQAGLDVNTPSSMTYRYGRIPLADDIEQIQRIVAENQIELVIVDSFGMAAGGDQDKSSDTIRFFQALRTLKVTSLVIDHKNKEGKQYGNVYKYNEARCVYEVKALTEPGADEITLGLYHRKMNSGKLQLPMGFKIAFEGQRFSVSRQDLAEVPEMASDLPLWQQITAILKHGAQTVDYLAEQLEETPGTVRATLNAYKQVFQVVPKPGQREHLWGLLSPQSEEV